LHSEAVAAGTPGALEGHAVAQAYLAALRFPGPTAVQLATWNAAATGEDVLVQVRLAAAACHAVATGVLGAAPRA
jgi:hypothetical protein